MSKSQIVTAMVKPDGLFDSAIQHWVQHNKINTEEDSLYVLLRYNKQIRKEIAEHAYDLRIILDVNLRNLLRYIDSDAAMNSTLMTIFETMKMMEQYIPKENGDNMTALEAWHHFKAQPKGKQLTKVKLLLATLGRLSQ
jgi:hypothetical protein